jgi:hypothetical protein
LCLFRNYITSDILGLCSYTAAHVVLQYLDCYPVDIYGAF